MLLTIHIALAVVAVSSLAVLFYLASRESRALLLLNALSSLAVFGTGVGLLFQGANLTRTCALLSGYLLLQAVVYRHRFVSNPVIPDLRSRVLLVVLRIRNLKL